MRKIIIIILVLLNITAYSQKAPFIGDYENNSNSDTSVDIYISRDSVKQVSNTFFNKGKEFWLNIKCGTWVIKSYDPENGYWVTFKFDDGSVKDVIFIPRYNSPPLNNSTPPDSYMLKIGYDPYASMHGKNGLMSSIKMQIKSMKQVQ